MSYETFTALHRPGAPLILRNFWDLGSARAAEKAGDAALASSSWAVAVAQGAADGEALPFAVHLDLARRVTAGCRVPVTMDIEGGYAADPAGLAANGAALAAAGVVGLNLEDSHVGALRPVADQAARIAALRAAVPPGFFINARSDAFFGAGVAPADAPAEAIVRAHAYRAAGADGLFLPGLAEPALIAELVSAQPLPLNLMARAPADITALTRAGAARISFGPHPYLAAIAAFTEFLPTADLV